MEYFQRIFLFIFYLFIYFFFFFFFFQIDVSVMRTLNFWPDDKLTQFMLETKELPVNVNKKSYNMSIHVRMSALQKYGGHENKESRC